MVRIGIAMRGDRETTEAAREDARHQAPTEFH